MIVLDSLTQKLQAVLAGAVATLQPQCLVCFYDVLSQEKIDNAEYRMANKRTDASSTTDVDICLAPTMSSATRNIAHICIYNRDTAAVTVTVKIDDAGVETILLKQQLLSTESLLFSKGDWQIL